MLHGGAGGGLDPSHSGSSIFRFLALHSHAGPKVPVHITLGAKEGLAGSAGGAKIIKNITLSGLGPQRCLSRSLWETF